MKIITSKCSVELYSSFFNLLTGYDGTHTTLNTQPWTVTYDHIAWWQKKSHSSKMAQNSL